VETSCVSPAVYRVSHQRLVLSCVRLGLRALAVLGAVVAGADAARADMGAALRGGGVRPRALHRPAPALLPRADPLPMPHVRSPAATRCYAAWCLARPASRSSPCVAAFRTLLAAILAGVLLGIGIVSLASWAEVVLWERRPDVALFADAQVHTRRCTVPRHDSTRTPHTAHTDGRAMGESVPK
jgi:hypothetical protein